MSRARPLCGLWWDQKKNNQKATVEQLQLLAVSENLSLDDLLDEGLLQGETIMRLRLALHGQVIPPEVLARKRQAKIDARLQPRCRMGCDPCEGMITRHHFVPRWLMLELENYSAYAARSRCTVPICLSRHRDLHIRNEGDKSIAQYLTDDERAFAQKMLTELKEQHPRIFELLLGGDESTYEHQLVIDYVKGQFVEVRNEITNSEETYKERAQ